MKKMKLLPLLSLILSVLACVPAHAVQPNDNNGKTLVVFDIGDVLIGWGLVAAIPQFDPLTTLRFAVTNFFGFKELATKKGWFNILREKVGPKLGYHPSANDEKYKHKNLVMPPVMRDHQKTQNSDELCNGVSTTIDALEEYPQHERAVMNTFGKITFDAKTNAAVMVKLNKTIELVKECIEAGHDVALLSNYNGQAYDELEQKYYEDLFKLFPEDRRFVSGKLSMAKPDDEIFQHVINRTPGYSIRVFIDDHPDNVAAAKRNGMIGILHNNAFDTREQLVKEKILNSAQWPQHISLFLDKHKKKTMLAKATIAAACLYLIKTKLSGPRLASVAASV